MKQLHCPLNGLRNINEFICFGEVDMDSQELNKDARLRMGESPVRNYWLDAGWGTWGFSNPDRWQMYGRDRGEGTFTRAVSPFPA